MLPLLRELDDLLRMHNAFALTYLKAKEVDTSERKDAALQHRAHNGRTIEFDHWFLFYHDSKQSLFRTNDASF